MDKSPEAFRTISEVADWLGTPAHVLRFWESKFAQVKPIKRAGGRRYYRPADMALLGGLKKLLHEDGLSIKAAQSLIREQGVKHVAAMSPPLDDEDVGDGAEVIELAAQPIEAKERVVVGLPPAALREAGEEPVEAEPEAPARRDRPDDQPELPFLHRPYGERMPQAAPDRPPLLRSASVVLDASIGRHTGPTDDAPAPEPEPLQLAPLAELHAAVAALPGIDPALRTTLAHRLVVLRDRMSAERTA